MENRSIFKIEEDYIELMNAIEEAEGVLTPEMETALTINQNELERKSMSYLGLIKTKEAQNLMIDEEVKRLTALKKRNDSLSDMLKKNLLGAVHLFGGDKKEVAIGLVTFCTRKSTAVTILDANNLKQDYVTKKVTTSPDKKKIGADLKEGKKVAGAELTTNYSLRIK